MLKRLYATLIKFRLVFISLFNIPITAFGYIVALGLRFDFDWESMTQPEYIIFPLSVLVLLRFSAYMYWRLNQGYWRYVSVHDLVTLLLAHLTSTVLFATSIGFFRVPGFPRSVIFIEFILSLLLAGGSRLLVRLASERFLFDKASNVPVSQREVIILGAGDSGHFLVKSLISSRRLPYIPVAVLDDHERFKMGSVHGVPIIGGLTELEKILSTSPSVSAVICAIPSLSSVRSAEIEQICQKSGVLFKRLQAFEDIACLGSETFPQALSVETALQKEIAIEHEQEIREALRGKHVLVTGAGGSIGSEIVRQILSFAPASILLLDHAEFNLFEIEREVQTYKRIAKIESRLASICDEGRLLNVFSEFKPEIVFHAAAYKHVPLVENNCYEAFRNNIVGSRNVLRASHLTGVKRVVFISTDKAVDPISIMGCSKRIAEILLKEYADTHFGDGGLETAVVRFGNVINSAGSVVPLFKRQILEGGPITVTHPQMERYFMSIREAVRLVLTAGTLGGSGQLYVLDMGHPIKIVDVAKKMLTLYGRRDIPIVFTGIRPGERLNEELYRQNDTLVPTRFKKVSVLDTNAVPKVSTLQWITAVESKLLNLSDNQIAEAIQQFLELVAKTEDPIPSLGFRHGGVEQ